MKDGCFGGEGRWESDKYVCDIYNLYPPLSSTPSMTIGGHRGGAAFVCAAPLFRSPSEAVIRRIQAREECHARADGSTPWVIATRVMPPSIAARISSGERVRGTDTGWLGSLAQGHATLCYALRLAPRQAGMSPPRTPRQAIANHPPRVQWRTHASGRNGPHLSSAPVCLAAACPRPSYHPPLHGSSERLWEEFRLPRAPLGTSSVRVGLSTHLSSSD
jgi:hypothetical protein